MRRWGVVLNVILVECVVGSNILVWNPTIGHSHVMFLGNIADVLTANGHNVVRKPCIFIAYVKNCTASFERSIIRGDVLFSTKFRP